MTRRPLESRYSGFTMIEVISVLVIVGVLSFAVVSRTGNNAFELRAMEATVKSHVRYAQAKAMHSDDNVMGIRFDVGNDEYFLFQCLIGQLCSWGTNMILPPGGNISDAAFNNDRIRTSLVNISIDSIDIGGVTPANVTLVFSEFGVPYWFSGTGSITFADPIWNTAGLTRLGSDLTVQLSDSATTGGFSIASETGFMP